MMNTKIRVGLLLLSLSVFITAPFAHAATPPPLGAADSFTILSGTYSNSTLGTTINGDLGYTTPPAVTPIVNGVTHIADAVYNQAGIDQGTALSALNSQPCTFSFAPGAIDLASDTTHGVAGVYVPGVYCISGAASIGGGGTITLTGAGAYIFRMTGALNSSANSSIATAGGASVCNVWWTPGAATTLGANSTFGGTVIDASGISIGNLVTWTGRALAFGGTVTTNTDTINSSPCSSVTTPVTISTSTPGLPNTGLSQPKTDNRVKSMIAGGVIASSLMLVLALRKRT